MKIIVMRSESIKGIQTKTEVCVEKECPDLETLRITIKWILLGMKEGSILNE